MPVVRLVMLAIAKTFSKLFSIATVTFFGRAPTRDDDKLGLVGVLSLVWLGALVSVAVPEVAETLIPFLPDDEALLRGVAIAMAVLLPPVVGITISRVQNQPDSRRNLLVHLVFGYGYAAVIGLLTVSLVLVVPVVKATELARRFDLQHLAVMVPPDRHEDFREHVTEVMSRRGHAVHVDPHPAVVRALFRGLARTEARIFRRGLDVQMRRLVADINGQRCELTLHATDLSILAPRETASHAFALLADELDPRIVYFSWDDASQRIERAVCRCMDEIDAGRPCDRGHVQDLVEDLRQVGLEPPEWNAVRRQLYRVECASERLRGQQATSGEADGSGADAGSQPHAALNADSRS